MQIGAQPKVYPSLIQFITIGISKPKLKDDKAEKALYENYLPQNDELRLENHLEKEYKRIFQFSEDTKNHDFKQNLHTFQSVELALEKALQECSGRGSHPWKVTIIDYYGAGCTLNNGSSD